VTIEDALYRYLSTYPGLTVLIEDRIYPLTRPQKVKVPAVTYQKISGQRLHTFANDPGMATPRFQFSCFAETYDIAKQIAEQVRLALQNFSGTMGGVEGVYVGAVNIEDEVDLYEEGADVNRVDVEFIIWHEE